MVVACRDELKALSACLGQQLSFFSWLGFVFSKGSGEAEARVPPTPSHTKHHKTHTQNPSTNEACLAELKRRWVDAGAPDKPDWGRLLDGL
jgi:hypothetical protein